MRIAGEVDRAGNPLAKGGVVPHIVFAVDGLCLDTPLRQRCAFGTVMFEPARIAEYIVQAIAAEFAVQPVAFDPVGKPQACIV